MFDLDDTIVQSGSYISPRVLRVLSEAHEAGCTLSISSGRPLCIVHKEVLEHGSMDYCVCSNGAEVIRLSDGHRIVWRPLSPQDAFDCYRMLEEFKPAWNASFDGKAFFEWKGASYMLTGRTGAAARARSYAGTSASVSILRRALTLARRCVGFGLRMIKNRRIRHVVSIRRRLEQATVGVEKMGCSIPDEGRCTEAIQVLKEDGRFEVIRMGATEIEITARGVTKATGARELMSLLNVSADKTVAFGDGGNDLPLSEVVGTFVAVENAEQEVKDAATEVCPSVADDGVAVWIEKNVLGR